MSGCNPAGMEMVAAGDGAAGVQVNADELHATQHLSVPGHELYVSEVGIARDGTLPYES